MTEGGKGGVKRSSPPGAEAPASKRPKNSWKKQQGLQRYRAMNSSATIENGNRGIFVTCDRGREKKGTAEVLDILSQEIRGLTPVEEDAKDTSGQQEDDEDIEAQIKKEVEEMKRGKSGKPKSPIQPVNLDTQCLVFIKLDDAIDPVETVHRLCRNAQTNPQGKRVRWVRRLTPITTIRKVLGGGLEAVAEEVLKPHFHSGGPSKKFAIRPTIRNNATWNRDDLIKTIARMVGPDHSVDLKNYDLLILVDVLQAYCGMSVVGSDYDELRRYNISELYQPAPQPQQEPKITKESEANTSEEANPTPG